MENFGHNFSNRDPRPVHPDTIVNPDPLIETIFSKMMTAEFDMGDESFDRLARGMAVALPVNDAPAPPGKTRHPDTHSYGLAAAPPNTATKGPYGGTAFVDIDGDFVVALCANYHGVDGVAIRVNDQGVFIPLRAFDMIIHRLLSYRKGQIPPNEVIKWGPGSSSN